MINTQLITPVAFLLFNRPETTAQVFAEIRRARPQKLLVVADGPRIDRPGEAEKCRAARAIIDTVDWPCEVLKNYSDENLGCKVRVSGGLDWVFEHVEEAIILEDDCLPHPTFFLFCQELLEKYKDDQRVMQISGSNFQDGKNRSDGSYYFSRYAHIWGWASWRRAWAHYDVAMNTFPEFKAQDQIRNILPDKSAQQEWLKNFQAVFSGKIDTWDVQWTYTVWSQNGLTIIPNVNMISNIGFGAEATHTTGESNLADKPRFEIRKVTHPSFVLQSTLADDYTAKNHFAVTLNKRIVGKLKRILKRIVE